METRGTIYKELQCGNEYLEKIKKPHEEQIETHLRILYWEHMETRGTIYKELQCDNEYWRKLRNHMKNKLKHIGERHWEHVIESHVRCAGGGGAGLSPII
jgi:hypothetical protein